jgi:hypothetical protein
MSRSPLFFPVDPPVLSGYYFIMSINYWKLTGLLVIAVYFFSCAIHPSTWHFIDGVNLIIHEAGHPIFSIFGEFIGILGGTITQLLIPCMFAFYFWWQAQYFEMAIIFFWIGQSLINVSVYLGDAVTMNLPLLGGETSIHDWSYLLGHIGVLDHATGISHSIYVVGLMIILTGMIIGFVTTKNTSLSG